VFLGLQLFEHPVSSGYEMHHNEKRAFTPYSHLNPLPAYASVQKRQISDHALNPSLELNHSRMLDAFGNAYSSDYGEVPAGSRKVESSFSYKPTTLQPLSSRAKNESSQSYNDLCSNWPVSPECYQNSRPQMNSAAASYTMPSSLGSSGKYFRSLEGDPYPNTVIPSIPQRSPTRTRTAEFPDYTLTKETEIHWWCCSLLNVEFWEQPLTHDVKDFAKCCGKIILYCPIITLDEIGIYCKLLYLLFIFWTFWLMTEW